MHISTDVYLQNYATHNLKRFTTALIKYLVQ